MKTKLLVALIGTLVAFVASASEYTSTAPRYNIFTYWVIGPIRTNVVADTAYDPFAEAMVAKLYTDQTLVSVDVGHELMPEHLVQPPEKNNNSLHLVVRVVGVNGAKVSLSMLRGVMTSSDNAHTLNNSYTLGTILNLIYSPKAWGITYGPGGARISDSIDKGGPGTAIKDEIVFIGMQSKYYPYSDAGGYAQINTYISQYSPAFTLMGMWEVVDTSGVVLGSSHRTLRYGEEFPMAPTLSITDSNPNVTVGVSSEHGRTVNLYVRPRAADGTWSLAGTFNANDVLTTVKSAPHLFYNAVLQPNSL